MQKHEKGKDYSSSLISGNNVVGVFTFAATVSGRTTPVTWFQRCLAHCRREGAATAWFVDAALAGLCVARDCLDLRADADAGAVRSILDGAMGTVQSGFKDFGLSSMLFLDDAGLESCAGMHLAMLRKQSQKAVNLARDS